MPSNANKSKTLDEKREFARVESDRLLTQMELRTGRDGLFNAQLAAWAQLETFLLLSKGRRKDA